MSKRILTVHMPADLYNQWESLARQTGGETVSKLTRDIIQATLESGVIRDEPSGRIKPYHQPPGSARSDLIAARERLRSASQETAQAATDLGKLAR